ncbi:MAG: hypothetical protein ACOC3Z_01365 [Nanoarchaeota archaeon]
MNNKFEESYGEVSFEDYKVFQVDGIDKAFINGDVRRLLNTHFSEMNNRFKIPRNPRTFSVLSKDSYTISVYCPESKSLIVYGEKSEEIIQEVERAFENSSDLELKLIPINQNGKKR